MKKFLMRFGVTGFMACMLMVGGCGGGSDSPAPVVPPVVSPVVEVSSATSPLTNDASTADKTYKLASGMYTYTISNFAAGDKLVFPAGAKPEISNTNANPALAFEDNEVKVIWTQSATEQITVVLTGLAAGLDAKILSVDGAIGNINDASVFGAGTVTQL